MEALNDKIISAEHANTRGKILELFGPSSTTAIPVEGAIHDTYRMHSNTSHGIAIACVLKCLKFHS